MHNSSINNENKENGFSRREIILICLLVLVAVLFIICYINYKWSIKDVLFQNWTTIIISVTCSVLASAMLPKKMQTPNSDDIENLLRTHFDNLNISPQYDLNVLTDVFREEATKIANEYRLISPSAIYMDNDDPNPEFNEKLNESIRTSEKYIYFSDRAMYTSKRLLKDLDPKYVNPNLKITIFLADIRDNDIFRARATAYIGRERRKPNEQQRRTIDKIIEQEKKDILSSIYCLSKLRDRYAIQIYLHKEIPFVRFEITDNMLVMTFLNRISTGKKHPTTIVYTNENVYKPNFEEFSNELRKRSQELENSNLSEEGILQLGNAAGLKCDINTLREYYEVLTSENRGKK